MQTLLIFTGHEIIDVSFVVNNGKPKLCKGRNLLKILKVSIITLFMFVCPTFSIRVNLPVWIYVCFFMSDFWWNRFPQY